MNKIEEFIKRRWQTTDANWCNGNCYWFAIILTTRFTNLSIYYLPVEGHFVAGDNNGTFYDARGKQTLTEKPLLFSDIKKQDSLWYKHLIRDCVL